MAIDLKYGMLVEFADKLLGIVYEDDYSKYIIKETGETISLYTSTDGIACMHNIF